MTTATKRRSIQGQLTRLTMFSLLALVAVLSQAHEARAQWVTSGTNTTTTSNVGIGTTTPSQNLHVHSGGTYSGTRVTTEATGNTINDGVNFGYDNAYGAYVWNREASPIILSTTNTERMRINAAGNIGIGTSAPTYLLDVSGSTSTPFRVRDSSGEEYFSTSSRTGPWGRTPIVSLLSGGRFRVEHSGPDGGNETIIRHLVNGLHFSPSDHPDLPGIFGVWQVGGTFGLAVDQKANGNVGIGTGQPQSKLHVVGDIRVDGNINAKYQDVAEWVPSREKLAVGTVVIVDSKSVNHVLASSSAYDTSVAGVITGQPGLLLGDEGEGKVKVATTGRVKVKVDATRFPIRAGDLLVTSSVAGVAMRSEPVSVAGISMHRPGTLIGKALESLDQGTGEILVLLSLQ